ncbi:uncharacterized protein BYT42DRAFT_614815 [Radiomyces spectabilis]|uniref:uncharacterized protein n=1 Tax=Radiomyces spectabilis TaxID=64574 RepID=UPI00221F4B4B|nr:uncharacterized protein BYT42DRAFT_614815 [Radiomyces spectabilis]KAI8376028.1 hypothetical protein BYT42DRAFT_614815 [Radiomyces spectabilis]
MTEPILSSFSQPSIHLRPSGNEHANRERSATLPSSTLKPQRPKFFKRLSATSIHAKKGSSSSSTPSPDTDTSMDMPPRKSSLDSPPATPIPQYTRERSSSISSFEPVPLGNDTTSPTTVVSRPKHHSLPLRRRRRNTKSSRTSTASDLGTEDTSQKFCGDYPLANDKRNDDFHALFRSVPDNDALIEDYKCALQKEILLQGHIYVSQHHLCFKANIFGWVTNLVIAFSEITSIEKRMTAKIIPNGIQIATANAKHIFASFLSRDHAYDQMIKIWKMHHHHQQVKDDHSYHETVKNDDKDMMSSDGDSVYDTGSTISVNTSKHDQEPLIHINPPVSNPPSKPVVQPVKRSVVTNDKNADPVKPISNTIQPQSKTISANHHATNNDANNNNNNKWSAKVCPCRLKGEHYAHVALDECYDGTVEMMYRLLFDSDFIKGYLEKIQHCKDVSMGHWYHGIRMSSYKSKLPDVSHAHKAVKCYLKDERKYCKISSYVCVVTTTQVPDMPMGAVFAIKTRTCITRVGKSKVRLLVTYQAEFKQAGLMSSLIEKDVANFQLAHHAKLNQVLRSTDIVQELVNDQRLKSILNEQGEQTVLAQQSYGGHLLQMVLSLTRGLFCRIRSMDRSHVVLLCLALALFLNLIMAYRVHRISNHLHRMTAASPPSSLYPNHLNPTTTSAAPGHDLLWMQGAVQELRHRMNELKSEAFHQRHRLAPLLNDCQSSQYDH